MGRRRIDHSQTVCQACRNIGSYYAKGLCHPCYAKAFTKTYVKPLVVPRTCGDCGNIKKIHGDDLCSNCYQKKRRRIVGLKAPGRPKKDHSETICFLCGAKGNYHAKGQCKTCYYAKLQDNLTEEQRRQRADAAAKWNIENKARYDANRYRNTLHRLYGLTPAAYEELKTSQAGRCALCNQEKPLGVDHNHATKEVRGLLCTRCNFLVGHIEESGNEITLKAIEYVSIKP